MKKCILWSVTSNIYFYKSSNPRNHKNNKMILPELGHNRGEVTVKTLRTVNVCSRMNPQRAPNVFISPKRPKTSPIAYN